MKKQENFNGTILVAVPSKKEEFSQLASYNGSDINVDVVMVNCSSVDQIPAKLEKLLEQTKTAEKPDKKRLEYIQSLLDKMPKKTDVPRALLSRVRRNFPTISAEKCIYLP